MPASAAGASATPSATAPATAASVPFPAPVLTAPTAKPTATAVPRNPALRPLDARALQKTVRSLAAELMVPGAVVLVQTPAGEFSYAYGTRTYRGTTPVGLADHIRIGSITKTWTGTVILQLVQEGKLKLDDPVSKYRRGVPNGRKITIAQLLDMRSGLYSYSETPELNEAIDARPGRVWAPADLLALAWTQRPYFAPDNGFYYSNTNAILLGLIAEKLDGKPLARIFQDRLFTPLGMKDSMFPAAESGGIPAPHPQGYMYGTNTETLYSQGLPAFLQQRARAGSLKPGDVTALNPSWIWAAGAGVSSAADLATWARALAAGKLLNARQQRTRLASTESPAAGTLGIARYGLALAKFGGLYGHAGELPGFSTFAGYDPANHVTLVVWANLTPAPDGRSPATTIARAVARQVYAGPAGMEPLR
ncbi:beta-lactamase family protein [Arthrobacter sp. I2-34]|uniref:Beta-lactamase family protein n=1 Tax=Arthrobacter hankyongi TaxID=2904801 RepID=A0ABS9LCI9_9MICC|nr:serine hydrolase domain-containing protein [Arthrobacter hankyongi]MCG2624385.1 beta-lactamase family protein [Arthrobacter hankyongi]